MIFTHQLYIDTLTAQNTDRGFKTTLQANNHKVLKVIFLSLLLEKKRYDKLNMWQNSILIIIRITWMLHQIFLFSNKVKRSAG